MEKKKLIEVALPLDKINEATVREKSIRHGHPSTLHFWWARRPLASARAVIWASLVDDPSSHPEEFPTEKEQNKERERLFKILEDLVVWENSNDEKVLEAAKAEILKSTNNNPPALLDPFAGGGAIPLEAQRLGLEAHAHDLNPVAVMINKAMIEIPPRFVGKPPINPDARGKIGSEASWPGTTGLAEDVQYYGELLKREALKKVGYLYPKVKIPHEQGGGEGNVVAWIWARTVKCPNPACNHEVPLIRSFILSKKKGKESYLQPEIVGDNILYKVNHGTDFPSGTVERSGAHCLFCGQPIDFDHIRKEGLNGRMGAELIGIIGEGEKGKFYITPDDEQRHISLVEKPEEYPTGPLSKNRRDFKAPIYGLDTFDKLFTNRQLTALVTLSDGIKDLYSTIEEAAIEAGMDDDHISLFDGGNGALAYTQAISIYLAFVVSKLTSFNSTFCSWNNARETINQIFMRQVIAMTWDYAEANPFSNSSGSFNNMLTWVIKSLRELPAVDKGHACQFEAQSDYGIRDVMVVTDPPYYDNIEYADLSDFFYIWLKKNLVSVYPELFQTMLVPKEEELIASPFRHGGSKEKAKAFFESEMLKACKQMYKYSRDDIPVAIYYAYKQNDAKGKNSGNTSSSGWETMLSAIIESGFSINGTWPMRTEKEGRALSNNSNALASSIVLVCRKRSKDAPVRTRRSFINDLKKELRPALQKLQSSNIAPVDLAQSAIGPGMAVFSKYSQVLESDGTAMSVRDALKIINQELDVYLNEQDTDLDNESRFCVELYSQNEFKEISFGDANILANAKNTSIDHMVYNGILFAQKGKVYLIKRDELSEKIDRNERNIWRLCQQLTRLLEKEGIDGCARAIMDMFGNNAERAKDLAYRLYTIAEKKGSAQEANAYNSLVVAWPEIMDRVSEFRIAPEQITIFS